MCATDSGLDVGGTKLFGRFFRRPEPDAIEVIIGPKGSFQGELRSDTSIRIDGTVRGGRIETPVNVILTEGAQVACDIRARTVSIRGVFRGTIDADRVELLAGCQVYGTLNVASFFMDENVLLRAELNIRGMHSTPHPALPSPAPEPRPAAIPVVEAPSRDSVQDRDVSSGSIPRGPAPAES